MSSSQTPKSQTHVTKALNPNPQIVDNDDPLSSKTPEKPPQLRRRARSYNVALSVEQIRRSAAKSLFNSPQKQSTDEIDSWPVEIPKKMTTRVRRSVNLPEKYEILGEFFNCLDFAIRRLKKRSLKSSFTNICSTIEYLTNRKFTYGHLAQLKFVLPEVFEIKKVLFLDEKTRLMKPDLHVSMNVGAVVGGNEGKVVSEGGVIMHLRRAFRKRLADISKSHPEDYEIPEETLPHPFNTAKRQMNSDGVKLPSSSSAVKVVAGEHTVEQSAVSTIFLEGKEIRDEMHPSPSDQSMEDLSSDNNETHKRLLSMKTSFEVLPKEQQPAIAAYLSRSFQRQSSQEDTKAEVQAPSLSVPESNTSTVCFVQETNTAAASSYNHFPATPTKGISAIENYDSFPRSANIEWTPEKLASNPSGLMTTTPALHPPKRCYMSTDVHSASSPNKLVKRPPCSMSLKYNTPVKNELLSSDDDSTSCLNKLVRHPPCSRSLKFDTPVKNKMLKEEALFLDRASIITDISGVLSEDLLQSIRDKERKAVEEQNAILRANRRLQMISGLPKLFNMIRFLFQSMNSSFMKKEDLIDKIVFSHSDSVDGGQVEEQLQLLLELVPGWISENVALIKINRMSNPESVRARLEEAR